MSSSLQRYITAISLSQLLLVIIAPIVAGKFSDNFANNSLVQRSFLIVDCRCIFLFIFSAKRASYARVLLGKKAQKYRFQRMPDREEMVRTRDQGLQSVFLLQGTNRTAGHSNRNQLLHEQRKLPNDLHRK